MKQIKLNASIDNLQALMDFVADSLSASESVKSKINIACDEILSNIVYYSGATYIKITVSEYDNEVSVAFADNGISFNPLEQKSPELSSDVSERQIGGLGIFMVKKLMDKVTYKREEPENILTIVKAV